MNIVIVDCGIGNRAAIANMLQRLNVLATISNEPAEIVKADGLIIPGVGSYDAFMKALADNNLVDALNTAVLEKRIPVLGICLGMQILFERSAEGVQQGLGWLKGEVCALDQLLDKSHKVPHIGWRQVEAVNNSFTSLANNFYFVHSYYCQPQQHSDISAQISIGEYKVPVAVKRDNIYGVQFHPEKSHKFGLEFFKEFIADAFYAANHSSSTVK